MLIPALPQVLFGACQEIRFHLIRHPFQNLDQPAHHPLFLNQLAHPAQLAHLHLFRLLSRHQLADQCPHLHLSRHQLANLPLSAHQPQPAHQVQFLCQLAHLAQPAHQVRYHLANPAQPAHQVRFHLAYQHQAVLLDQCQPLLQEVDLGLYQHQPVLPVLNRHQVLYQNQAVLPCPLQALPVLRDLLAHHLLQASHKHTFDIGV